MSLFTIQTVQKYREAAGDALRYLELMDKVKLTVFPI